MADIKLTLMVARAEDGHPVDCGAWESSILDIIGMNEVDKLFADARNTWLPDFVDWREVDVTVDRDAVLRSFESPTVRAEVTGG